MMQLMCYTTDEWHDMAKLFMHEKNVHPKDLWEILVFWRKMLPRSPQECLKIGMQLSACEKTDTAFVSQMIVNFLAKGIL